MRSKKDWSAAVVTRKTGDFISLSIASPTGYNYRVRRNAEMEIGFEGLIPILLTENDDKWSENFTTYDRRW